MPDGSAHLGARRFRRASAATLTLLSLACASAPKSNVRAPVFYPPLPNPPRIQHLKTFSSDADVSSQGRFSRFVLGKTSSGKGAVRKPYGVALSKGQVFIVDTRGPGYHVFDVVNGRSRFIRGDGPGRMVKPINITIDTEGTRYVTDTQKGQVLVFDRDDRFRKAYGAAGQFKPSGIALAGDQLYVTDLAHHQVHVLNKATGQTLLKFGKAGSKEGELFFPTNIDRGPKGDLYVSDTGNFRICVFQPDGTFVRSFGSQGTALGQFARPKGVSLDREGRMYVVDAAFENVQIFDPEGRLLLFFGEGGGAPENTNLPTSVAIDYESAASFQKYADPKFKLEYVVLVASQFGVGKVNAFGFGRMEGFDYRAPAKATPKKS